MLLGTILGQHEFRNCPPSGDKEQEEKAKISNHFLHETPRSKSSEDRRPIKLTV